LTGPQAAANILDPHLNTLIALPSML